MVTTGVSNIMNSERALQKLPGRASLPESSVLFCRPQSITSRPKRTFDSHILTYPAQGQRLVLSQS